MGLGRGGIETAVELPGDVALEAAAEFGIGLAFCAAPGDVGPGSLACAPASQEDVVQGAVEVAVAAAVEPVTDDAAAAGGDRAGAGERCVCGVVAAAARVGPGHDRLVRRSSTGPRRISVEAEFRHQIGDQVGEVALVIGELSVDPADGEGEAAGLGAPDGVFAGLVLTAAAAGDGSEPVGGQRAAGQRSVSITADGEQRAQTIDRPRLGCGEFPASAKQMRSASRSPSARGVGSQRADALSAASLEHVVLLSYHAARRR